MKKTIENSRKISKKSVLANKKAAPQKHTKTKTTRLLGISAIIGGAVFAIVLCSFVFNFFKNDTKNFVLGQTEGSYNEPTWFYPKSSGTIPYNMLSKYKYQPYVSGNNAVTDFKIKKSTVKTGYVERRHEVDLYWKRTKSIAIANRECFCANVLKRVFNNDTTLSQSILYNLVKTSNTYASNSYTYRTSIFGYYETKVSISIIKGYLDKYNNCKLPNNYQNDYSTAFIDITPIPY